MINRLMRLLLGDDRAREVSNKELMQYALGVVGQNMTYGLVANWLYYYCTDVVYLDVLAVGLIFGAARIWDAINDPLVGMFIDRHTFRDGEKMRPYLKWTAIPIGLLSMMMFVNVGLESGLMLLFIAVLYFFWDTLYSFQDISQWGMTAMMTTSTEERGRVAQAARVSGMIGGWGSGLIPLLIDNGKYFNLTQSQIFCIFGVVLGFGGMALSLLTYKAKERAPVVKTQGSLKNDFKLLFKNKLAMLLVIANIISSLTFYVDGIYFFKYMVSVEVFGQKISGTNIYFVFNLIVGIPGSLGIFFANKLSKKVGGMKNILMISVVLDIVCRVAAYLVGFEGYRILITGGFLMLAGIPNNMRGVACTTLWGDSIDYMEWKTGQRNEGGIFAMQNFVSKIGSGMHTVFMSLSLSLLAFDSTKYEAGLPQSDNFYRFIWPIYILGPAVASLLYAIPLLFVRYDMEERHLIEKELKLRRAGASATPQTEVDLGFDIYV